MADWKSLFPFIGEKTVARRLDEIFSRELVVSSLFGAAIGGLSTTIVSLVTPTKPVALLAWGLFITCIVFIAVYWKTIQKVWDETTEDD